jgi:glycosyltransferase involved in cell wall biosynthesis
METVSILLPAHNEGGSIYANIGAVRDTARALRDQTWKDTVASFDIVVVDDGSSDTTAAEIRRAETDYPEVTAVVLDRNKGKGAALREAFKHSTGSLVFFIDADLDIGPEHMAELYDVMVRDAVDGVLGSKQSHREKTHYPLHRRIVSLTYSLMVNILLPLPVKDTQTGFKLFRRDVLERVFDSMLVRRYAQDIELLAIAHRFGYTFSECPVKVTFAAKPGSVTLNNIYNMFIDTLAVFYRLRVIKYYDNWQPKTTTYLPMISVVIAVKHDNDYLRQSVTETLKQDYPHFEILVLPDDEITGYDPRVRIIPTGNKLPALKRNMGVAAAEGDVIAFIDDDAYPVGNWLKELAGNFVGDEVGAVGGPGLTPPEDSYWQQVSGAVYASLAASGTYRYRYIVDRRRDVDDYPTCNLAVRKSVFNDANGFQTNYWPGEDTELCLTITKTLGKKIVYDPLVEVNHHRRSLWNGHFRQVTQYALHRGYFVKKFPETSFLPQYFFPSLFIVGASVGWITWWFRPLFYVYIAVMILYLLFVAGGAFLSSPRLSPATILGTILTHYAYGIYFIIGLLSPRLNREEEKSPHHG